MVKSNFICKPIFNLLKKDMGSKWINKGGYIVGSNNRENIKKMKEGQKLCLDECFKEIESVLVVLFEKKTGFVKQ